WKATKRSTRNRSSWSRSRKLRGRAFSTTLKVRMTSQVVVMLRRNPPSTTKMTICQHLLRLLPLRLPRRTPANRSVPTATALAQVARRSRSMMTKSGAKRRMTKAASPLKTTLKWFVGAFNCDAVPGPLVLAILKPVAVTMMLVIWVVKTITIPYNQNFSPVYMVYKEVASDDTSTKLLGALLNALVFVVVIVIVTVIFVILYKYRCLKYMWKAYNLPMDWVTFVFMMWNFTGAGVISIFWYAPQRWNQAYLVLISAFMAIFFTRLPEWTTWTILAAIALYDVFAVLCPRGPLRVLVETAQQRQEPIPALLYNGFVVPLMINTLNMMGSSDRGEGLMEEDKRPQSVKLGLGDFVFYSVLVGRAAMFNWLTVFTCFIAIITGLFWTLLLLAVFRKALPALPFSIALGIFFFFLSKVFLLPFVLALGSSAVFV
ncbi:presenilin subfamily protein, partial [Acanthamoeba castellanii str. Neff]